MPRTMKNIKTVSETSSDEKVKEAVDEYKKNNPAKFTEPTEEEVRLEIEGKVRERLHIQENFNEAYVTRLLMEARMKDMGDRIEECVSNKESSIDWMGFKYSLEHMKAVLRKEFFDLKRVIRQEEYFRDQLARLGFKQEDFNNIIQGKYISDMDTLKKMEESYGKK